MTAYIEFLYPGIMVSESSYVECPVGYFLHPEKIILPKNSFGFRFVTRSEVKQSDEILKGEFHAQSGWYYEGVKQSKSDVASEKGKDSILYRNMENNGYDFVVKTVFGQCFPLREKDVVLK